MKGLQIKEFIKSEKIARNTDFENVKFLQQNLSH